MRSLRMRSLRSGDSDQGREVPRAQGPRGVQLRPPALRGPEAYRLPGHRVFLFEAKNVVLLGPHGTGKTHLAVWGGFLG
ncbi:ATP-binding protein [Arthrobacter sp. EM1]|uniref:ATP-binding protein n=1 Tax=unclassified Arthrobacter TaxID=235627 RepID=UPI0032B6FFFD